MPEMSHAGNIAFQWCSAFIGELYYNGLEHAVISPGSRSTPLTLALAFHKGIKKHILLDERSAGFTALGIAKATGRPAILVCTSGTAAANYYPAVIEARRSGTPLIALTSDRPPLLRNIGAPQSMDQIKLYGNYPVFFFEAGEPSGQEGDLDRLKILACQAWQESRSKGGPVHINFPFRKPLEPEQLVTEKANENPKIPIRQLPKVSTTVSPEKRPVPSEWLTIIKESRRPLIIDGPRSAWSGPSGAGTLSSVLKAPLLAEATANNHGDDNWLVSGFDGFLRDAKIRKQLKPDLVVRFGYQPVTKGLELFLEECGDIPHIHIGTMDEWQDPVRTVTHRFNPGNDTIDWSSLENTGDTEWTSMWTNYSTEYKSQLTKIFKSDSSLTDGRIYYELLPGIPAGWQIHLSNSFPVRDIELFNPGSGLPNSVLCNRGVSGIDGITSTAIGAAIGSGKSGILFTGDLAFLHDVNGLMAARELKDGQTLIIVIINNNGGNIFKMLPVSGYSDVFEPFFVTPQHSSIKKLAEAHNIDYVHATKVSELKKTFTSMRHREGVQILECVTDPEKSMKQRNMLWNRK